MSHETRSLRRTVRDPKRKGDFKTWWFIVLQNLKGIYTATRVLIGLKRGKRESRKKVGRIAKSTRIAMLGPSAKCVKCGAGHDEAQLTLDHIVPSSKGGKGHKGNCQVMCEDCNQKKGSKTKKYHPTELRVSIRDRMDFSGRGGL